MAKAVDRVGDVGHMVQLFVDMVSTCAVIVSGKSQSSWVSKSISEKE